jgi:hypothetical protein
LPKTVHRTIRGWLTRCHPDAADDLIFSKVDIDIDLGLGT